MSNNFIVIRINIVAEFAIGTNRNDPRFNIHVIHYTTKFINIIIYVTD